MFRGRMANPCSNKYTHSKYIEHCQELHKKKLAQMKPAIDNKAPKKPSHFRSNRKREQMMEDRFARMERENRLLLEKMSYIMQKKSLDNRNDSHKYTKSLNKPFRKKELQRITEENKNILRRIQKREPFYNHMQWEIDRKRHEGYLRNICEYKGGPQLVKRKGRRKPGAHSRRSIQDEGNEIAHDQHQPQHQQSGLIPRLESNNATNSSSSLMHSQSTHQFRTDR